MATCTVVSVSDLEYDGVIYIRPIGRGVQLVDLGWKDLDEAIDSAVEARHGIGSGWRGRARITVEIRDTVADEPVVGSQD